VAIVQTQIEKTKPWSILGDILGERKEAFCGSISTSPHSHEVDIGKKYE